MSNLRRILFQYKFLIITFVLAIISLAALYVGESYKVIAAPVTDVLRPFAVALLTSGVVGFVFEYLTRSEFTEVIRESVNSELTDFEKRIWGHTNSNEALQEFWQPFVNGAEIIIAQDETGVEPTIRAADVSAALILYKGLQQEFLLPGNIGHVDIDFVPKYRPVLGDLNHDHNLILIGAPGSNPLTSRILFDVYGLPLETKKVLDGFVFVVDNLPTNPAYLSCPYIIPAENINPGIQELKNGKVIRQFDRVTHTRADTISYDCCLLVRCAVLLENGRQIQVLIIAGHSRFATIDGINFVLTNEEWAKTIKRTNCPNTTSILITSTSMAHGRVVKLASPPQPIKASTAYE